MFRKTELRAKFYRLDFRPPSEIAKSGFQGTNSQWYNNVFGPNTVFASKSLKGISRFYLESVMNRPIGRTLNPSPSRLNLNVAGPSSSGGSCNTIPHKVSPLHGRRDLYPANKPCYVYEIEANLSDVIDVSKDLNDILNNTNYRSILFHFRSKVQPRPLNHSLEEFYAGIRERLNQYNENFAKYTEEIIIFGPISKNKIKLYQTL